MENINWKTDDDTFVFSKEYVDDAVTFISTIVIPWYNEYVTHFVSDKEETEKEFAYILDNFPLLIKTLHITKTLIRYDNHLICNTKTNSLHPLYVNMMYNIKNIVTMCETYLPFASIQEKENIEKKFTIADLYKQQAFCKTLLDQTLLTLESIHNYILIVDPEISSLPVYFTIAMFYMTLSIVVYNILMQQLQYVVFIYMKDHRELIIKIAKEKMITQEIKTASSTIEKIKEEYLADVIHQTKRSIAVMNITTRLQLGCINLRYVAASIKACSNISLETKDDIVFYMKEVSITYGAGVSIIKAYIQKLLPDYVSVWK